MGYVPLKNNTFHFSFQKGILLICIFIHTGGIDGTHLSCLYLKWLAPSTQKSNDRRYCRGKGHSDTKRLPGYASVILTFLVGDDLPPKTWLACHRQPNNKARFSSASSTEDFHTRCKSCIPQQSVFSPWSESISTKQKRWGQVSENTLSLSVHLLMIPTRQSACTKSLYELKRTVFSNVALGIILLFNPLQIFTILFYLGSPILGRVTTTARGASRRALNSPSTHER